ncbi:hypothetical protein SAMN05216169_10883 [Anoxybacillus pushchinoensis]|uniref:Transposase, Mutator family n=1 Tax=Anoxybacillus pushchinoensis TaxID=150248 RepID=A0A1I0U5M7_9BACL|nr:hypothetical protein SAMN05216169_10883 [Anoxybacillus pushchinoensis]
MSKSISNIDWANQLENAIRQFVKEKLELIMREEIKNFLEIEQADTSNMRNGYYQLRDRTKKKPQSEASIKVASTLELHPAARFHRFCNSF